MLLSLLAIKSSFFDGLWRDLGIGEGGRFSVKWLGMFDMHNMKDK